MNETNFTPRDDYRIRAVIYAGFEEFIRMAGVHNGDKFFPGGGTYEKVGNDGNVAFAVGLSEYAVFFCMAAPSGSFPSRTPAEALS